MHNGLVEEMKTVQIQQNYTNLLLLSLKISFITSGLPSSEEDGHIGLISIAAQVQKHGQLGMYLHRFRTCIK